MTTSNLERALDHGRKAETGLVGMDSDMLGRAEGGPFEHLADLF